MTLKNVWVVYEYDYDDDVWVRAVFESRADAERMLRESPSLQIEDNVPYYAPGERIPGPEYVRPPTKRGSMTISIASAGMFPQPITPNPGKQQT